MDLMEKAILRKQIEDMMTLRKELKKDLALVKNKIKEVDAFLVQYKLSSKEKKTLEEHKKIYTSNQKEIEETLTTADDIINNLKTANSPRGYLTF